MRKNVRFSYRTCCLNSLAAVRELCLSCLLCPTSILCHVSSGTRRRATYVACMKQNKIMSSAVRSHNLLLLSIIACRLAYSGNNVESYVGCTGCVDGRASVFILNFSLLGCNETYR